MDRNKIRAENKVVKFEDYPPVNLPVEDTIDNRPSVLVVGIENGMYSSMAIKSGWEDNGYRASYFDWQRIKFEEGVDGMRDRLEVKVFTEKPDIIFLHLQNPETLNEFDVERLSEHAFVINYTEDVREDTSWYESLAPKIGLTIFTNVDDVKRFERKEIKNVGYIPASYNHLWYMKTRPTKNYTGEIVFVGNNYVNTNLNFERSQQRVEMVEFLKLTYGDRFRVWGMGWEGSNIVNPMQEVEIYNNCKIAITHNNFLRAGYTSDRMFRAMGCGAATISQYFPGINQHFGVYNIGTWIDFDMLEEGINMYLKHNHIRESVAQAGYDEVVKKHRWNSRVKEIQRLISTVSAK